MADEAKIPQDKRSIVLQEGIDQISPPHTPEEIKATVMQCYEMGAETLKGMNEAVAARKAAKAGKTGK